LSFCVQKYINQGEIFMKKLMFLLVFSMFFMFAACGGDSNNSTNPSSAEQARNTEQNDGSLITSTFTVSGMTCRRCVTAIDREVSALGGVISASTNLRSGVLTVEHEPEVSIEEIKNIVILEGFSIE